MAAGFALGSTQTVPVKGLAALGLDLEAVAGKGEPVPTTSSAAFAVAFRLCCSPAPLQFLLGFRDRLREGGNKPGPDD